MDASKKAAMYIRVSTAEQADEGYSLAAQRSVLTTYAANNGYEVYRVYADEGISGRSMRHREQLCMMLEDSKSRLFNAVLVWKVSRFARSIKDLSNMCDMLEKNDVHLISYSEAFDCSTAAGRLMLNMLGSISQWESDVISENVQLAMRERASRGERTCGEVLGYDIIKGGGMTINSKEAAIVRSIFEDFETGASYSEVSRRACARGYRGKRGKEIRPESVYKILTCSVYAGYYRFRDMVTKGDFEPMVSGQRFNSVQDLVSRAGTSRKGCPIPQK